MNLGFVSYLKKLNLALSKIRIHFSHDNLSQKDTKLSSKRLNLFSYRTIWEEASAQVLKEDSHLSRFALETWCLKTKWNENKSYKKSHGKQFAHGKQYEMNST